MLFMWGPNLIHHVQHKNYYNRGLEVSFKKGKPGLSLEEDTF